VGDGPPVVYWYWGVGVRNSFSGVCGWISGVLVQMPFLWLIGWLVPGVGLRWVKVPVSA
jgi:hypothetical protein